MCVQPLLTNKNIDIRKSLFKHCKARCKHISMRELHSKIITL